MNRNGSAPIALAATVLSLLFSFVVLPRVGGALHVNLDPDRLGELAANIWSGQGYSYVNAGHLDAAFDRAPVYPFFVVFLYLITGGISIAVVQAAQAACHGITTVVVYRTGLLLYDDRRAAIAALIAAIHPMLIWYTGRIWIETLHTMLVSIAAYLLLRFLQKPTGRLGILSGLLLGVTSLTKSILLPFALLFSLVMAVRFRGPERRASLAIGFFCLMVVAPWTLRNALESGMFVPVHTSMGLNLAQGRAVAEMNNGVPLSSLAIWDRGDAIQDSILRGTGFVAQEPRGDRYLVSHQFSEDLRHPLAALKRCIVNAFTFVYLSESPLKSAGLALIEFPLMVLAFIGGVKAYRRMPSAGLVLAMIAFFFLVHAYIVGWARYSLPAVPLAIVLAVNAWPGKPASAVAA